MKRTIPATALLVVLGFLLFGFGNDRVALTDPDDVFYAETSKEMLTQGSMLTPILFGQPQFEKPPLYYWLVMAAFDQFGVNSESARLPSMLFGILGVLGTFFFLRRFVNQRTAVFGAIMLATTIWWVGLSRVVLTDMVLSTLIMLSLYAFYSWFESRKEAWLLVFAVLTALGSLTKGPLGLALPLMVAVVFMALLREWTSLKAFLFNYWWVVFLALSLPWYVYTTIHHGNAFLNEFFVHDHWDRFLRAEHPQFDRWYFYPAAICVFLLPWTAFLPFMPRFSGKENRLPLFLVTWVVVMAVIIGAAHSKLTTYISPVYPALALLVALGIQQAQFATWKRIVSAAILLIVAVVLIVAVFIIPKHLPALADSCAVTLSVLAASVLVAAGFVLVKRIACAVVAAAVGVLLFVILSGLMTFPKLNESLTQGTLPDIVNRCGYQGKTIMCSKLFARGALFYTGNPVVVMSGSPNPFWSLHPVTILNTDQQVTDFAAQRESLLCVLSPGDLRRFTDLTAASGRTDTLLQAKDKTVVLYRARRSPVDEPFDKVR